MVGTVQSSDEPAKSSSPAKHGHEKVIPELDGLRGIAILLVLLVHLLPIAAVPLSLQKVLSIGWAGVDLFFVLSGFLITGILLDTRETRNYFSFFYARRMLRIFPLYLLSVAVFFRLFLPIAHRMGYLPSDDNSLEPWFWIHLSNWKIAFGQGPLFIGHFWSLAIEEQFYLCWPLIVFLAGLKWLPYACVSVMTLSFGLRMFFSHGHFSHEFLYVLTPFRLEPLAFGSLAAWVVRNEGMLAAAKKLIPFMAISGSLLLLAVLVMGRTADPYYPPMATLGFTALALIFTALVLFAYFNSGSRRWLASQLRTRFLRSFGKYSYGIYVFHWPIFILQVPTIARIALRLPPASRFGFWVLASLEEIALTFGVALLSWNLMEKRFLKLKRFFKAK
jgi:peptidoglycan/LPS O-acetylase OafA/YrhL